MSQYEGTKAERPVKQELRLAEHYLRLRLPSGSPFPDPPERGLLAGCGFGGFGGLGGLLIVFPFSAVNILA